MAGEIVLKTEALTKFYGSTPVVDGLDLEVRKGDIYGLLGLRYSGKTTSIRLILGLVRPTSGKVALFGQYLTDNYLPLISRVGSLIDRPAFYPYLTARTNLEIVARLSGFGSERVQAALDWLDLADHADERLDAQSPGLLKKTAIAAALIGKPDLVILDQPSEGLDRNEFDDIRALARQMSASHGTTFMFSSDKLSDVESCCNRVGIIHGGRLVLEGQLGEVLEVNKLRLEAKVDRADSALNLLEELGLVEDPIIRETDGFRAQVARSRVTEINRLLVSSGFRVHAFNPRRPTLEEFFHHNLSDLWVVPGARGP